MRIINGKTYPSVKNFLGLSHTACRKLYCTLGKVMLYLRHKRFVRLSSYDSFNIFSVESLLLLVLLLLLLFFNLLKIKIKNVLVFADLPCTIVNLISNTYRLSNKYDSNINEVVNLIHCKY